jgi:pimeloyl-ACP methyl ester carboxylesterase
MLLPPSITVIAPDLPGHGSRRDRPFTFGEALTLAADALDALAPRPTVVVGDSLGGYLALALAARTSRPLAGVVAGGCTYAIAGAGGLLARASGIAQDALVAIVGERIAERGLAAATRRIAAPAAADAVVAGGFRLAARGESLAELARYDTLADVRAVAAPIVFINGAWDWPLRSGEDTFLAAARMGSRIVVPRRGHGVGFTAPAAFALVVVRLLDARRDDGRDRGLRLG